MGAVKMKKILMALLVAVLFGGLTASAAPQENDGGASNGIFVGDHMKMTDDSDAHYIIDTSEKTKEEIEQSMGADFIDTLVGASPWNIAKNNAIAVMDMAINFIFEFNQQMVNLMIGVLNFGFDTNIVDSFIDMVEGVVQEISGLSGVNVGGGLFGSFVMFAIVTATFVAAYQLVFRNASIAGLQTMLKSIMALSIAFLLIGNFGTIMKGMSDITTWVSASALTGTTNFVTSDNRSADEMMDGVNRNMWDLFIGKPYLVLQYGTDNVENIGEERINELLAMPAGTDRDEFISEVEVAERDNTNMTVPNTTARLGFTVLYSVTNALVSIPVYAIAILHIIFDFWFLLIAFLAPFVTIFAVFPGQFKVLQRYAIELAYPLICKVLVSFVMVFIFAIGFVAYSLPAAEGMPQYFTAAIFQFALFALLFIMRKRIKAIFSAGSHGPFNALRGDIQDLRSSVDKAGGMLGKTARMGGHLVAGVMTGGASAGASQAIETAITLKENQKKGEDASKPIASIRTEVKTETDASKPMGTIKDPKETTAPPVLKDEEMSKPFASIKVKENNGEGSETADDKKRAK